MFKTKKTQFAIRKLAKGAVAVLLSFGILAGPSAPIVSAASEAIQNEMTDDTTSNEVTSDTTSVVEESVPVENNTADTLTTDNTEVSANYSENTDDSTTTTVQTDTDVSTQEKTDPETSVNTEQPIQTEEAESTTPVEDVNSKSEENVSQNNNINTSKEGTNKIRHEDGGPAFYSQERIGKNEKPFKMWKFRSMVVNADQMIDQLEDQNEINGAMFKIKDDPRITKIGHTIRKYSLDELPQLWNVLIGDMSLVGPRPPLPSEVEEYTDYDKQRLLVMPGCTGLWQVTKRNEADFDEMVWLDIVYINHSGLWKDFKLIIKTIGVVIHPNGAY